MKLQNHPPATAGTLRQNDPGKHCRIQSLSIRRILIAVVILAFSPSSPVALAQTTSTIRFKREAQPEFGEAVQRSRVLLADLDRKPGIDAVVFIKQTDTTSAKVQLWLNDGGTGKNWQKGRTIDSGIPGNNPNQFESVAVGDLDGKNGPDLYIAVFGAPDQIWLNDGSGIFSKSNQTVGNSTTHWVGIGELDRKPGLDLFLSGGGAATGNSPGDTIWFNDGKGNFTDSGQAIGTAFDRVHLADLNKDGKLDAFLAAELGDTTVWLNDGNGVFSDTGKKLGGFASLRVALGDLDGNGAADAWIADLGGLPIHQAQPAPATPTKADFVFLNDGAGKFTDTNQRLGTLACGEVSLSDLDGDKDLDAWVSHAALGTDGVAAQVFENKAGIFSEVTGYLDDATGTPNAATELKTAYPVVTAVGDLNGDGTIDAFHAGVGGPNFVTFNSLPAATPPQPPPPPPSGTLPGLWTGTVTVDRVSDGTKNGLPLAPSAGVYRFRILLHYDGKQTWSLLREVAVMREKEGNKSLVLVTDPAKRDQYEGVVRRSGRLLPRDYHAVSYDFKTVKTDSSSEKAMKFSFNVGEKHPTNPMRHKFHPDLRDGFEITRTFEINDVKPVGPVVGLPAELEAQFAETITGLRNPNQTLKTAGTVRLHRVSDVAALTN